MIELEEMWINAQREAMERKAKESGRGDVADYLRLREVNDAARQIGIDWLLETFITVATEANRRGFAIEIKKSNAEDLHVFKIGPTTMRGKLVRLQFGIRSLNVEAGYPRLPQDGFVRGNGLACARIIHFGQANRNADLQLVRLDNKAPRWFIVESDTFRREFDTSNLAHHFKTFIGEF